MQFITPTAVTCPYCGEGFELEIDTSIPEQELIEDCTVCCRPITLEICCQPGEVIELQSGR